MGGVCPCDTYVCQRGRYRGYQAARTGWPTRCAAPTGCARTGWPGGRLHWGGNGKVEMLFVHPAWRGQGIGRRLLSYVVTTLGASELDVNEQNPQAIGFYLRMGFEVVGRSAVDSIGKPYPLLHMQVRRPFMS
ncbi:MAG TPA: GNAT family N-acetyltransferase [Ktedonobacterales bacterium]|nr:GNAT family N-acetyltransferase [Ktedonobacterales bacterium]